MPNLVPEHRLNYRLVTVEGSDALSFLQSQLCNDVSSLACWSQIEKPVEKPLAQLSGYCNAKGRLYTIFWIWRENPERFQLLMPASLAASVVKRLSMFVLRAKVKVREADSAIYGLSLPRALDAPVVAAQGITLLPAEPPALKNPDAAARRYWLIGPDASPPKAETPTASSPARVPDIQAVQAESFAGQTPWLEDQLDALLPSGYLFLSPSDWAEAEIRQGLPWFEAELSERFVPQTINLDLLDGVSFTKGCYPGQEIVARSHYLGKLNQRMFLFEGSAGLLPGEDVFLASAEALSEQPIGEVVTVTPVEASQKAHYLVSLKLEPFRGQAGLVGVAASSGERVMLELQDVPYVVPREPQVPNRPKL
jgi:folate-binding protein YgfZ